MTMISAQTLKRKHVTLSIVWVEYIAGEPGGYRYSRFCERYRAWEGRLSVTMRQSHAAGDKLFVDYAGDGVPVVIDRRTGERRSAQIFVAVLGASSFTYAQATWTQGLADWISGHVGAFEAIGGVPALLVPDNTRTAVIKACLYDPQINRSYANMAAHYGTAILPARKDAAAIGPATAALCELILDERAHPEQGFRACLGIIRLARSYGNERLDAAATRAIDIGARTYGSVKSILANNL